MKEQFRNMLKEAWNVPNILTMIRLALVPVFAILYASGHVIAALVVFCTASITDMFDGYLARKNHQITAFGKLMDPLADKLLVITALAFHCFSGVYPKIAVFLLIFKEVIMIVGALLLLNRNIVVYANYLGKTSTCFFIASLIAGFFHDSIPVWTGFQADVILLWISLALAYLAGISYGVSTWKQLRHQNS